jgi:hypothetical protein
MGEKVCWRGDHPAKGPSAGKGPKKAGKGSNLGCFSSFLLVFSTRLLQNSADDKRVKYILHQTQCSFFRFLA